MFNTRLSKDLKPSVDVNTLDMTHKHKIQVEGRSQLCNHCSCVYFTDMCVESSHTHTYIDRCGVDGVSQVCDDCFLGAG